MGFPKQLKVSPLEFSMAYDSKASSKDRGIWFIPIYS